MALRRAGSISKGRPSQGSAQTQLIRQSSAQDLSEQRDTMASMRSSFNVSDDDEPAEVMQESARSALLESKGSKPLRRASAASVLQRSASTGTPKADLQIHQPVGPQTVQGVQNPRGGDRQGGRGGRGWCY